MTVDRSTCNIPRRLEHKGSRQFLRRQLSHDDSRRQGHSAMVFPSTPETGSNEESLARVIPGNGRLIERGVTITTAKYNLNSPELRKLYNVTFFNEEIETLVTDRTSMVTAWIGNTEFVHRRRFHKLVVNLDIEWPPNTRPDSSNPVATIQLCVDRSCLIFQLLYERKIPKSLIDFNQRRRRKA